MTSGDKSASAAAPTTTQATPAVAAPPGFVGMVSDASHEVSSSDDRTAAASSSNMSTTTDVEKAAAAASSPMDNDTSSDQDGLEWDGLHDAANPLNWPVHKKAMQVICVALMTLLSNLAATMFAPGASQLMPDFGFDSVNIASLTVSIYLLGYAVAPLLWAPLSETYGRLPVYAVTALVYCGFTLGCAFSTNLGMFIAFRILAGAAGSCPTALCGGTLADVFVEKDRGRWMGLFVLGPLAGPVIGPIAGGFIAETIGWRWVFRVLLIAYALVSILCLAFLRETYGPVILRRRAASRGESAHRTSGTAQLGDRLRSLKRVMRPLTIVLCSPMVWLLSLYAAFTFGLQFILFTTFPEIFEGQYGFSVGISGLAYLGLGIGMFAAVMIHDVFAERLIRSRAAAREGGANVPEDRLPLMAYLSWTLPAGMFWYGWSVEYRVHWIVPILGTVLIGAGSVFIMMPQMMYLVQSFGSEAGASAIAVNMIVRYIAGAFLPLAGPPMYEKLGYGWGNSLLGFLGIAFMPLPWALVKYGEKIRSWNRTLA